MNRTTLRKILEDLPVAPSASAIAPNPTAQAAPQTDPTIAIQKQIDTLNKNDPNYATKLIQLSTALAKARQQLTLNKAVQTQAPSPTPNQIPSGTIAGATS